MEPSCKSDCSAGKRDTILTKKNHVRRTRQSKIRAYEAIVKPVLMYGEPAWRPSAHKAEEQLERVQKCAAQWINASRLVQEKRWDTHT